MFFVSSRAVSALSRPGAASAPVAPLWDDVTARRGAGPKVNAPNVADEKDFGEVD